MIRTTRRRLLVTLPLASRVLAAAPGSALPAARQQDIEKFIASEMSRYNVPGISAALAVGGELVSSNGFGFADVENNVPAKGLTVYRTASIAKVMTAVAVMQLAEAGKIDLDAPVQRYVPAFPVKPWPVTVRHLLCHQSGIRHYRNQQEIDSTRHFTDIPATLKAFANDGLIGEPGTLVRYSTYAYVLLGAVIEAASSMRYMQYLRDKIFAPAGMERTRQDHHYSLVPNRAHGYSLSAGGQLQNSALADTSNKVSGGGLLSTAEDLVRFALAFRRGALLRQAYVDMMLLPARLKDGRKTNFGLGWKLTSVDGRKAIWHDGGQQGVSTMLLMLPHEGIVVSLMCNLERVPLPDTAARIAHMLEDVHPQHDTSRVRQ
ncbi:MAG: beta-lactamase family protein [Bryobacterales bacterium]|nr:beta-lactamase family protein [Bryobacterales bacterium]